MTRVSQNLSHTQLEGTYYKQISRAIAQMTIANVLKKPTQNCSVCKKLWLLIP